MKKERDVYRAIADPTRRSIIELLSQEAMTMNALADHFPDISRPAVSKHVKMLNECGLIDIRPEGRERYCFAQLAALSEVQSWVAQYESFWNERLDRLGEYLDRQSS